MLFGAMNFPVKPVLQEIREFAKLGFDYFELTMDPPQAHYLQIRRLKAELRQTLKDLGMGLVAHLPTFVVTADLTESLRKASLDEMLNSLETAAELGAWKAVVHPGHAVGLGSLVPELSRRYMMESLESVIVHGNQLGIRLCVENMPPRSRSLSAPEDFEQLFSRHPRLYLTLDTGHANLDGGGLKNVLKFIEQFPNRIGHVHAHDNFGRDDNHLPPGTGTLDFPCIVGALRGVGYDGTVTLEVFSGDRDYLRISREKMARWAQGNRP